MTIIYKQQSSENKKRPTWANWEDSKTPPKTQEATPGNPRRKMHNTHHEPDTTNLDHKARRRSTTLRPHYIPQPLAHEGHRTRAISKWQKRGVLDALAMIIQNTIGESLAIQQSASLACKRKTHKLFSPSLICLMSSAMAYEAALRLADPNSVQSFSYWGIFFT